jgi:hypothetical protein
MYQLTSSPWSIFPDGGATPFPQCPPFYYMKEASNCGSTMGSTKCRIDDPTAFFQERERERERASNCKCTEEGARPAVQFTHSPARLYRPWPSIILVSTQAKAAMLMPLALGNIGEASTWRFEISRSVSES